MRKTMKKQFHLPSYIRNFYFLILSASLLFAFLCGVWGISLLSSQHRQELSQIGNIAGAILTEYPEAEELLITTLRDTGYRNMDDGFAILAKYGYRKNLLMSDIPYYRFALSGFASLLALLIFCCLTLISLSFYCFYRKQKNEELLLHALLDRYLSEDYSSLQEELPAGCIFSESFTDTLYKLGNKLKTKTQALTAERDDTKTLVTDISHQLKTPVSALKSCFAMCMEADTEEERTGFQIQKLESLVTVLVNISRLETSLITLKQETVPLSDLLADAVNTVYEKALQKGISIEVCTAEQEDVTGTSLFLDRRWSAEAIAKKNIIKFFSVSIVAAIHS